MTQVFISYAHEDQAFVANMARALEAEGFSVWWDHTIPPGRTWETFIARGITEARCCIVVWSGHSVASDWVKEEATLAKDGGKYLPVAISDEQPPMGFRRIQAAQLKNWNGDRANPQWQLLVGEVRALVGGTATPAPRIPEPRSSYPPPPPPPTASPGNGPNWALIGGIGAAAIAAIALFAFVLNTNIHDDVVTPPVEVALTEQDPVEASAASDPAELERMRGERDAAIEREREQRAENERLRNLTAPNVAAPSVLQPAEVLGVWRVIGGSGCAGDQRFVLHGANMSWDWLNGETWSENSQSNGPYVLDANSLYINGRKILERRDDGFWIVSSGPGGTYNCHVAR